jgi:hypothetical protein
MPSRAPFTAYEMHPDTIYFIAVSAPADMAQKDQL